MPSPPAPVFLIGAARSGTKITRDAIGALGQHAIVPYDMNFIWRLGNDDRNDDELTPGSVSPATAVRIRRLLARAARGDGPMLEKTVSNTLRVPFVDSLFPASRFIHLVRDGGDVVESVLRQWHAPADLRYLADKLRAVPALAAPRYLARYGRDLAARRLGRTSTPVTWGPRYAGIDDDVVRASLATVCARQWRLCVEHATTSLAELDQDRVLTIRYEHLVTSPFAVLSDVADFLGVNAAEGVVSAAASRINPSTVGRGLAALGDADARDVRSEISRLGCAIPDV